MPNENSTVPPSFIFHLESELGVSVVANCNSPILLANNVCTADLTEYLFSSTRHTEQGRFVLLKTLLPIYYKAQLWYNSFYLP